MDASNIYVAIRSLRYWDSIAQMDAWKEVDICTIMKRKEGDTKGSFLIQLRSRKKHKPLSWKNTLKLDKRFLTL